MPKTIIAFLVGVLAVVGSLLFWILCLNHVPPQAIGVAYDSINGQVSVQRNPGWYVTHPFVQVASVETRPFQVCINAGARILNCKLIRFNPDGATEFVKLQGFHYWNGPSNCNSNPGCQSSEFGRIMMGYAYAEQPYPFLEILEEIKPGKP